MSHELYLLDKSALARWPKPRVAPVLGELSDRGLIAATAERHGVTVLHYDGDFDLITAITGQPTTWVAPAGTAD